MLRPPPKSKRTDTRLPDTTLFRSGPYQRRAVHRRARICGRVGHRQQREGPRRQEVLMGDALVRQLMRDGGDDGGLAVVDLHRTNRSEEHTSELQSLMRISYAVFCLKKKKTHP